MSETPDIVYGRLLESAHISGYSFERVCAELDWLLDEDRWCKVGPGYDDINGFLATVDLSSFKLDSGQRKPLVRKLNDLQASQRAMARAIGVDKRTVGRDLNGGADAPLDESATELQQAVALAGSESGASAPPGLPDGQGRANAILADIDEKVRSQTTIEPPESAAWFQRDTTDTVADIERGAIKAAARDRKPAAIPEPVPLPAGKFQCVVIDPPWPMQKIERDERPKQGLALDYVTMDTWCREPYRVPRFDESEPDEARPCFDGVADDPDWLAGYEPCGSIQCNVGHVLTTTALEDSHLYLWVTHKFLPDGMGLMRSWGFNYQCVMTWRKNVGITPYSWMYDTEHVLFGRRGNLPLTKLGLRLSFDAPVRGHSIKPDVFYDRVREASPGPRLDMFPGVEHEGFEPWGLEASHREDL